MPSDWDVVKTEPDPAASSGDWSVVSTEPDIHPALAGLPQPHEAAGQAETTAQQVMDQLESLGHGMQQRQRMQQSGIAPELRGGPTEQPIRYDQFGEPVYRSQLDAPGNEMAEGGRQFASGVRNAQPATTGMYGVPLPLPTANNDMAGGLNKMLSGASVPMLPTVGAGVVLDPVPAVTGLVGAVAAQKGAQTGLKKAGASDEAAELGGNVAGLVGGVVGGMAGGHLAAKFGPKPALNPDVLGAERAPMDRQVGEPPTGSEASRATVDAEWQPVSESREPAASNPWQPVSETPEKGAPNDNRTAVPMGPGEQFASAQQRAEVPQKPASAQESSAASTAEVERPAGQPESGGEKSSTAQEPLINTRGQGQQFHGTSNEIPELQEYTYDGRNIYGQGFYTTDAVDVAQGYSRKGRGNAPAIYGVTERNPSTLLDMDQPIGSDALEAVKGAHSDFADDVLESARPKTLRGLFDAMRADSSDEGLSQDSVQEIFDSITHNLEGKGYAGLTHVGGGNTGREPHAVKIYFNPRRDLSLQKINPADYRQSPSAPGSPQNETQPLAPRPPSTQPAYGSTVDVNVPGEDTKYPARYAVRELSDVQPSHNPFNFQSNPDYEFQNDRDYANPQNAARVVEYAQTGTFNPEYTLTPSPTAEQGAPIIDSRGNVLGGNNRTMTQARVYDSNPSGADAYRGQLVQKAAQFGIDPQELARFKNPILTRELEQPVTNSTAQKAITDFNKSASAKLSPQEQAVADGRRLSAETIQQISGNLADVGGDSTLAQALQGERARRSSSHW